ncbi:MAG: peptidylprolyl isomerase [Candidatus Thioglobus sp.]|nr:MAG: peptidylprolyl isomerase [Candidatus Thioglobus sp.]
MRILLSLFVLLFSMQSAADLDDGLYANIHTNKGDIIVKLTYEKTPLTVSNFVGLAEGTKASNKELGVSFYDNVKFHRVIKDFMIQGGDPLGNGTGGPGYQFTDEITDLKHDKAGTLSMANSGKNTNGSQFFITHKATPHLDGKHTVFGYVVEGIDVVNSIIQDDIIKNVEIIRIGEKAKNFKISVEEFKTINEENLQKNIKIAEEEEAKKQKKLADFVAEKYPNASISANGYFIQIDQKGDGIKPSEGSEIKMDAYLQYDEGTKVPKKSMTFTIGSGKTISIIDRSALEMSVGEKRTIIARYPQVFNRDGVNAPLVIITLDFLSIQPAKPEQLSKGK